MGDFAPFLLPLAFLGLPDIDGELGQDILDNFNILKEEYEGAVRLTHEDEAGVSRLRARLLRLDEIAIPLLEGLISSDVIPEDWKESASYYYERLVEGLGHAVELSYGR